MTIEIVDFPINSMIIFNSYVSHYQAGYHLFSWDFPTKKPSQKSPGVCPQDLPTPPWDAQHMRRIARHGPRTKTPDWDDWDLVIRSAPTDMLNNVIPVTIYTILVAIIMVNMWLIYVVNI